MLVTDVDDGVFEIQIDRPEVKNAMSAQVLEAFAAAVGELDPSRHDVCIVTGTGDAFSAGGDIQAMAAREETPLESFDRLNHTLNAAIEGIVESPIPFIAKVNGDAIGAGANLAFATDFVIADETARFGEPFVHVGLIPDGGGTVFLPHHVGLKTVKELTMTGRLFDAKEAHELGLITDAVPPGELERTVEELVADLASKPTDILGLTKRAIHENLGRPYRDGLAREASYQTLAYGTAAHEHGVRQFIEKAEETD